MKRMTLQNAVCLYQADCKARNLSTRTMELNECAFNALRSFLEEPDPTIDCLTPGVLRGFFTATSENKSPSTSARYYDVLSSFVRWRVLDEFLSENPITDVQKPKKKEPPI